MKGSLAESLGKSWPALSTTIQSARGTLDDGSSLRERIERNARKFETWIRFQINIEIIYDGYESGKCRGPIKMRRGFEEVPCHFGGWQNHGLLQKRDGPNFFYGPKKKPQTAKVTFFWRRPGRRSACLVDLDRGTLLPLLVYNSTS